MMNNSMDNLIDCLFAEMDRLGDASLKGDELKEELERARGIKDISNAITSNVNTMLKAVEIKAAANNTVEIPKMLE